MLSKVFKILDTSMNFYLTDGKRDIGHVQVLHICFSSRNNEHTNAHIAPPRAKMEVLGDK